MAPVKELMSVLSAAKTGKGDGLVNRSALACSGSGDNDWGRAQHMKLRKLSAEDFSSALEVIRPTSVDQMDYAAA